MKLGNIGPVDAGNIYYKVYTGSYTYTNSAPLSIGAYKYTYVYAPVKFTSAGTVAVYINLDYQNRVIESDESNNRHNFNVQVT